MGLNTDWSMHESILIKKIKTGEELQSVGAVIIQKHVLQILLIALKSFYT